MEIENQIAAHRIMNLQDLTEEKQEQFMKDIAEVIETHKKMNEKLLAQGEMLQEVDDMNTEIYKMVKN